LRIAAAKSHEGDFPPLKLVEGVNLPTSNKRPTQAKLWPKKGR